ncbi:hypothetical protein AB9K41_23885, partial [Cribrihabitans sp. XS_ASV171]
LGPRKRFFRSLEVRLWVEEEIRLDLPAAVGWTTTPEATLHTEQKAMAESDATTSQSCLDGEEISIDPAKKPFLLRSPAMAGSSRHSRKKVELPLVSGSGKRTKERPFRRLRRKNPTFSEQRAARKQE